MNQDRDSIKIRIARLKKIIKEHPPASELPETIRHILKTAPKALRDLEITLKNTTDSQVLEQIKAVLYQMESYIEWATGEAGGQKTAQNILAGREPEPGHPADKRLMERITSFMIGKQ